MSNDNDAANMFLYLNEVSYANAWTTGGVVPLSLASKYHSEERAGTMTPDENGVLRIRSAHEIAAFAQKETKGKIVTWEKNSGGLYTHKSSEWKELAWLKASTSRALLTFNIHHPKGGFVSALAYAYYHGHLIETFLNHFELTFSSANASALPEEGDKIES
jgi:hypothetical protein